jgi:hypothetical protein
MTATQNRSDPPGPNPNAAGPSGGPGRSDRRAKVPRSRMGGVWVVLLVAAFVLALLLVFILQNGQRAEVFGILLVALPAPPASPSFEC